MNQRIAAIRIGELARRAGVSPDTLRHYERKGLLPAPSRSENRYRQYSPSALGRVQVIRAALAFGFSIDELANIFRVRDRGGAPCESVRALASAKLLALDARLRELHALRDALQRTLKLWDVKLKTAAGRPAGLLEVLVSEVHSQPSRSFDGALSKRRS